ncbi:oxaloacetate decarboxylase gamma chain 2 [Alcanivorax sp. S71-1-4]|jgi:oxaloacetate decarboxylase (Na+ extruding) subunit gamma|uniref:OadG family transporter subunit n=1 Tax=Alcanivorax sp. S71-1-4 TaxID=1177159 RepID=UPI00135765FD|nr:OadG family transporter subunit [Alcanivorax sp. S71-1-4]KAF0805848.1 oxaloacetate decarboxylase gamma chain 2 [Alcanivorax sp. S71-1-4]
MNELMARGLDLTLMGIGVVYAFLILLVVATTVMSRLINRFLPDAPPPAPAAPSLSADSAPVPPHMLAVLQDAVRQHRARQS